VVGCSCLRPLGFAAIASRAMTFALLLHANYSPVVSELGRHGLVALNPVDEQLTHFFARAINNRDLPAGVFRIDHDQAFQQTTQVQYQFQNWKRLAPYVAFIWRYDSGLVSGAVPDYDTALTFSGDQQAQIGLFCGNVFATPTSPILACVIRIAEPLRVRIPADGTANDDTNPPRIAPRHLFDLNAGSNNLFRTEHTKMTLRFSVLNLTNGGSPCTVSMSCASGATGQGMIKSCTFAAPDDVMLMEWEIRDQNSQQSARF